MTVLVRASFGYLWRHPWQPALALAGIAAGVAVMVAIDVANASAARAMQLSLDAVGGAATHEVVAGPGGVDERLYSELRVDAGLQQLAPLVSGQARSGERRFELLGVDVFAEGDMRRFRGAPGTAGDPLPVRTLLTTPGAALLSARSAAALGVDAGDTFPLTVEGRQRTAVLAGLLDTDTTQAALDELLVVDIATAQDWLGMQGRLSRIDVVLADAGAAAALERRLPDGTQLLESGHRSHALREMSTAFTTNLTAMSLLALLVGVFLIYNSVSFAVLQRRRLLGTLRALGVTRGATCRLILGEAALLGALGAALGIVAGLWLGSELLGLVARSINDLYFRVSVTSVALSPWTVAKGVGAGLAATLAAAALPAAEAAAAAPRLALARSALETRTTAALPWLVGGGAVMALLGALLLAASGGHLVAGLAALFLLVLGAALWIPALVRVGSAALAPVMRRFAGTAARHAVAGIGAGLSRTGVAIVALAVAVSATIGVTVMVESFRQSVSAWLEQSLQADLYVAVADGGDLDPALAAALVAQPGIAAHSRSRRVWLESAQGLTRLVALDLAPGSRAGIELLDAAAEEVWPAFEERGAVLISETLGYRRGVRRGDVLTLATARGERAFPVAATYRSYDANAGAVLISRRFYETFWRDDGIDALGIYVADAAQTAVVLERLRAVAAGRQALELRSNRELREQSLAIFDRTFVITDVLYWLAVGVAIVGILGALLALQMERARELAVLRALGMTPLEVGGLVTLQSGIIGLFSGLAALPLGLLMAWLLIDVINRRAFGWSLRFAVEPGALWPSLALAVAAALVAGLYPAWRAARQRPALAMRED